MIKKLLLMTVLVLPILGQPAFAGGDRFEQSENGYCGILCRLGQTFDDSGDDDRVDNGFDNDFDTDLRPYVSNAPNQLKGGVEK